jgi:hypothetical protein
LVRLYFEEELLAEPYRTFQWPFLHRNPGSTEVVPPRCQEQMPGLSQALSCRNRAALQSVQVAAGTSS